MSIKDNLSDGLTAINRIYPVEGGGSVNEDAVNRVIDKLNEIIDTTNGMLEVLHTLDVGGGYVYDEVLSLTDKLETHDHESSIQSQALFPPDNHRISSGRTGPAMFHVLSKPPDAADDDDDDPIIEPPEGDTVEDDKP
jgi:hypothetical protein